MAHLLVDIDGVLNPFLHPNPRSAGFQPCRIPWATWMLHPAHGRALGYISQKGHKLVWATTWEKEAHAVTSFYGIQPFDEVIVFGKTVMKQGEPKLAAIEQYCEQFPDEHIIWLEDEVSDTLREWAISIPNLTIITCDPRVGWTRDKIRETVERLEEDMPSKIPVSNRQIIDEPVGNDGLTDRERDGYAKKYREGPGRKMLSPSESKVIVKWLQAKRSRH